VREYSTKITTEAAKDIADLRAYYEDLVDTSSAKRFQAAAYATVKKLEVFPERYPIFDEANGVRRVNMDKHKVAILYIIDNYQLEVVAVQVFHELQDPDNYREMLSERVKA